MISIAIVEDEAAHALALKDILDRFGEEQGIVLKIDCFESGLLFLDAFNANYDLIFLDIELPTMSGMETAQQIRKRDGSCALVFITNVAQYAIDGYSVGACDYVLKPIAYPSMQFRLKRIFSKLNSKDTDVFVRTGGAIVRLQTSQILYVESYSHRVIFHTESGDYTSWDTMTNVEKMLPQGRFARCNSGYLVNLQRVDSIEGQFVVVGGVKLKISNNKKKAFTYALMDAINGINSPGYKA